MTKSLDSSELCPLFVNSRLSSGFLPSLQQSYKDKVLIFYLFSETSESRCSDIFWHVPAADQRNIEESRNLDVYPGAMPRIGPRNLNCVGAKTPQRDFSDFTVFSGMWAASCVKKQLPWKPPKYLLPWQTFDLLLSDEDDAGSWAPKNIIEHYV